MQHLTDKEYLLLSILAYKNFLKTDENKNIFKAFCDRKIEKNFTTTFKYLKEKREEPFLKYFEKGLKAWSILKVYNREKSITKKFMADCGFFAISFTDGERVVIAFRGSELFPVEEAIKDFFKTDFVIGIGKQPAQFKTAEEFYLKHVEKLKIKPENIFLTGHSLGGGLAQYISYFSYKTFGIIPPTKTLSAVGIKKDGIINLKEKEFKNFENQKNYMQNIINFGHSKDFTFNLFPHLGTSIILDAQKNIEDSSATNIQKIFASIVSKNKALLEFHFEDVFVPLISQRRNNYGEICDDVQEEYISAIFRKLIYLETGFSKKTLAAFYSRKKITDAYILFDKQEIIKVFETTRTNFVHKTKIISQIKKMSDESFLKLWKETKLRGESPFVRLDIYDAIIY